MPEMITLPKIEMERLQNESENSPAKNPISS